MTLKLLARSREFFQSKLGRKVVAGAGVALGIQLGGAVASYGMEIVLARVLGGVEYGVYTYALAWATLLAIPTTLGFGTALLRYVGSFSGSGQLGLLKGVVLRSWQMVLSASVIATFILFLVFRAGVHPPHVEVLYLAIWLAPLTAIQNVQMSMGRGLGSMTLAFAPGRLAVPSLLMIGLLVLVALGRSVDSSAALVLTLFVMLLSFSIQAGVIAKQVFRGSERPVYRTGEWLRTALPMLLIAGFMLVLARTDVLMLGLLAKPVDVGAYNAASKTANLVLLVLAAVNAIAAPMIADLHARRDTGGLQRLATGVAHLAFWPSTAIVLLLVVLGPSILSVFGPEFVIGRHAIIILALGNLVSVGVGSVGYMMNMTGHQNTMAVVVGAAAALNVLLNWLAIPVYGLIGAAGATALSVAAWNLTLAHLVKRRIGVHTSITHALRHLLRATP